MCIILVIKEEAYVIVVEEKKDSIVCTDRVLETTVVGSLGVTNYNRVRVLSHRKDNLYYNSREVRDLGMLVQIVSRAAT